MSDALLRLDDRAQLETDEEDGATVLIDGRSGMIFSCNETARVIASKLRSGATAEELLDAVLACFDVTHETARQDLEGFLDLLVTIGLLAGSEADADQDYAA